MATEFVLSGDDTTLAAKVKESVKVPKPGQAQELRPLPNPVLSPSPTPAWGPDAEMVAIQVEVGRSDAPEGNFTSVVVSETQTSFSAAVPPGEPRRSAADPSEAELGEMDPPMQENPPEARTVIMVAPDLGPLTRIEELNPGASKERKLDKVPMG